MADYQAPLAQMRFTLEHLADLREVTALPAFEAATPDLIDAVLEEAAKFASEVLAPINALGDREGVVGRKRRRSRARGLREGIREVSRRGLDGHRRESGVRRPGSAQDSGCCVQRKCGAGANMASRSALS